MHEAKRKPTSFGIIANKCSEKLAEILSKTQRQRAWGSAVGAVGLESLEEPVTEALSKIN